MATPVKIYRHSYASFEPVYSIDSISLTFYAYQSIRLSTSRWDKVNTGCEIELPDGLVMELIADENILTLKNGGYIESFKPLYIQGKQRQWVSFKFKNKTINFQAYIEAGSELGKGIIKTGRRDIEVIDV